ncbi:MAG TPA: sulfurtransferase complex subunit TusC [Fluviicoccus sp.]|nr:sulfurtransferase complex subunit TusC [Fluviicoccus sp.]
MKTPLYIQHRAPYEGHAALEMLDALLVSAAFGQNPAVLFQGDGVWQLLPQQFPQALGRKSLAAQLEALPLYDVENIFVEQESLECRGLGVDQLVLPVTVLPRDALRRLFRNHFPIMRF